MIILEVERVEPLDPIFSHEGKWYFWDEVWAHDIGPYDTLFEAEVMLEFYILTVLREGNHAL